VSRSSVVFMVFAVLGTAPSLAHAATCRDEIARLQSAARRVATNPDAGPAAPQSVGAQLGHQPTPESVKQAEKQAQSRFAAILARARALDARGRHAQCMHAVTDARRTLELD
jgi:hypothetical protein